MTGQEFSLALLGTGLADELTGIERLLVETARQVQDRAPHVRQTVVLHEQACWADELPDQVDVVRVPTRRGNLLRRWQPTKPFDWIHSFAPPLPGGRHRSTYSIYDWGPFQDRNMSLRARGLWSLAVSAGIRAADELYVLSEASARDVPRVLGPMVRRRPVFIGLPVVPRLGATLDVDRVPGLVLTVGTDVPRKRFGLLEEAVAGTELRLVVAGGGTDRRPAAANVETRGRVTDEELLELYGRASVFALVSTYEGFGLPVLEAWRAGCQIVVSEGVAPHLPREIATDATVISEEDLRTGRLADALASAGRSERGPRQLAADGTLVERIVAAATPRRT